MSGEAALDERITLLRTQSGVRVQFAAAWAHRTDVGDGERFAVGNGWINTARFIIRNQAPANTVRSNDWVRHEGKEMSIQSVKRTRHGRNRFLELTAKG